MEILTLLNQVMMDRTHKKFIRFYLFFFFDNVPFTILAYLNVQKTLWTHATGSYFIRCLQVS